MGATAPPGSGSGLERAKALIRRFVEEGINQGQLAVFDEILDDAFPTPDRVDSGSSAVKEAIAAYRQAVPDARWTIEEQVAEGEMVMSCFVASGTHHGPLWGIPATGQPMAIWGILISRCPGERIVEQRIQLDRLGLLQQLGVMPELGLEEVVIVARLLQASQPWTGRGAGLPQP
ncbi:MAG TPA: ester cyclase [Thermomicrobiaceae bacterium]|nr:ester cyclase [Thermomicrobiaceae bacterium]